MEKEIVTRANIKKDLKDKYLKNKWIFLAQAIFLGALCVVCFFISKNYVPDYMGIYAFLVCAFFVAVIIVIHCAHVVKYYRIVKQGTFFICCDQLVAMKEKDVYYKQRRIQWKKRIQRKQYIFNFYEYGEYKISFNKHYKWSEKYCMDDIGVYQYANIGDLFYLIIHNKKILFVYSCELFQLEE